MTFWTTNRRSVVGNQKGDVRPPPGRPHSGVNLKLSNSFAGAARSGFNSGSFCACSGKKLLLRGTFEESGSANQAL